MKALLTEKGNNESKIWGEHIDTYTVCTPIFVSGIVSTAIFIYYDSVFCCCCDCCLQPPGQISVYDPDNPELELVWRDGRVEEVSNDNYEEANKKEKEEQSWEAQDTCENKVIQGEVEKVVREITD